MYQSEPCDWADGQGCGVLELKVGVLVDPTCQQQQYSPSEDGSSCLRVVTVSCLINDILAYGMSLVICTILSQHNAKRDTRRPSASEDEVLIEKKIHSDTMNPR